MNTKVKDLGDIFNDTLLNKDLITLILKYAETSIEIVFSDDKIIYLNKVEFDSFNCENILEVKIYGDLLVLKNPYKKFKKSKIKTITGNIALVGNTSEMFSNAENFTGDISKWDVSEVTDMNSMFKDAINFNSDISKWDTSNVTNMNFMFYNAINFNQDISSWNTEKVRYMRYMFFSAKNFNQNINRWNVKNVTNMSNMFYNAKSFVRNLTNWDISNVIDMSNMF